MISCCLSAGSSAEASGILGQLRLAIAPARETSSMTTTFKFLWVVDFPLMDWSETEQRFVSMHHPFTSPRAEDLDRLETAPGEVRARAYDLVLNGNRDRWRQH